MGRLQAPDERLPPGQYATDRWPVLHTGPIPRFDRGSWDFRVFGRVEAPLRFSYDEFMALPQVRVVADMHCVTAWSTFDNAWEGVASGELLRRVTLRPGAAHVLIHAENGYTTNIPLEVFAESDVLFAYGHNGKPLAPEHGYPLRLVVPTRYAWKSAKWVRGVEFLEGDRPGFWEVRGYNNNADPWREERYG